MKAIVLSLITLATSTTFASGFECSSANLRVKVYNHVNPALGTKNAAVLVVSSAQEGTIAVVRDPSISTERTAQTVSYSGLPNGYQTGRFTFVELTIAKQPTAQGKYHALLTVNADKGSMKQRMICDYYLKN